MTYCDACGRDYNGNRKSKWFPATFTRRRIMEVCGRCAEAISDFITTLDPTRPAERD